MALSEDEKHHALHVMRLGVGSAVGLMDGQGGKGNGIISEAGKKTCLVEVLSWNTEPRPEGQTIIAVAPPKSADRLDFMLEKLTECGADKIILLETARTERHRIREERMYKVCLSALKQCKRSYLPNIQILSYAAVLTYAAEQKYIFSLQEDSVALNRLQMTPGKNRIFLIGPEGDFTDNEYLAAAQAGYQPIWIPGTILRTETAAIWACISSNS